MTFDARWKRIASCQMFPLLEPAQQLPQQHLSLSNGALVPAILSCCCAAPNFSLQRAPECLLISSHLSTPQRVCLWRNLRGTGNAVRLPLLLSPSVLVAPRPLYPSHSVPRCVCVCVCSDLSNTTSGMLQKDTLARKSEAFQVLDRPGKVRTQTQYHDVWSVHFFLCSRDKLVRGGRQASTPS